MSKPTAVTTKGEEPKSPLAPQPTESQPLPQVIEAKLPKFTEHKPHQLYYQDKPQFLMVGQSNTKLL